MQQDNGIRGHEDDRMRDHEQQGTSKKQTHHFYINIVTRSFLRIRTFDPVEMHNSQAIVSQISHWPHAHSGANTEKEEI
jgi:hypothetical protein